MASIRSLTPVLAGVVGSVCTVTLVWLVGFGPQRSAVAGDEQVESHAIAIVDTYSILEQMLQSEELAASRDEAVAPLRNEFEQGQARLAEIAQLAEQNGLESPEVQAIIPEFQQLQQSLQIAQQELGLRVTEVYGLQMRETLKTLHAATKKVANEAGFSVVISSRPVDSELVLGTIEVMVQELLARPVIHAPGSIDLTSAVRAELGLEEPQPVEDAGLLPEPALEPGTP